MARGKGEHARAQIHSQQPLRMSDLTNSDDVHGGKKLLMQLPLMIHPSILSNPPVSLGSMHMVILTVRL